MASVNQLTGGTSLIAQTVSGANAEALVTIAAPGAMNCIYVYGIMLSASAAPAATVAALFKESATTKLTLEIPASPIAPVWIPFPSGHPYRAEPNTAVSLSLPALGGATIGTAALIYSIMAK